MAISWGAWEGHVRVGIDVSWGGVSHGSTSVTATVKYYTGVDNWDFNDSQTLNFTGAIGGSVTFTNTQGANSTVLRATKSWTYNYSTYGSSPGDKTFGANLSGVYTGGTPSKSVTSSIPARPYGPPAAPTDVGVSRGGDTSGTVTWVNHATAGEPYNSITLQRSVNGGSWTTVTSGIPGGSGSYADGTAGNTKYRYQVAASNSVGSSGYNASGDYFTAPSAPTGCARTGASGSSQTITWTNSAGYSEYLTEIWRAVNGAWALLDGSLAAGVTSYVDNYPISNPTDAVQYKVRHTTTAGIQGTLYSEYSNESSSSTGVASSPDTPTNLYPTGGFSFNGSRSLSLKWRYHSTDGSPQTQFQIRHRTVGNPTWTTTALVTSPTSGWVLPAGSYTNGQNIEWQVRTRGSSTTTGPLSDGFSGWSTSATLITAPDRKIPLVMNLATGLTETDVTGSVWHAPTLLNDWTDWGSGWETAGYYRAGGIVYLRGLVKAGSNTSTGVPIFILPVGYCPDMSSHIDVACGTNDLTRINILSSGEIQVNYARTGLTTGTWLSLANICFPAARI